MKTPLLIVFLGFPGSGKTYFSKRLAHVLPAVTLNSDALRISMFGSIEVIEQIRVNDRSRLYDDVFGAMNYATKQTLEAGYSVIYDAQMTKRTDRIRIERLAAEAGALPILVWVKTSRDVAIRRGQERQAKADSHPYSAEKIAYLIDRFSDVTDLPETSEPLIEINGETTFEEQYASFSTQLNAIHGL